MVKKIFIGLFLFLFLFSNIQAQQSKEMKRNLLMEIKNKKDTLLDNRQTDLKKRSTNIYNRRSSTVLVEDFLVNDDYSEADQNHPDVAADVMGNCYIVWDNEVGFGGYIYAQKYDRYGNAQGSNTNLIYYLDNIYWNPTIVSDAAGNFVMAASEQDWLGWDWDLATYGYGRRFDRDLQPFGNGFCICGIALDWYDIEIESAIDNDGNLVYVWEQIDMDYNGDFTDPYIMGQRFSPTAQRVGYGFTVSTQVDCTQGYPSVAFNGQGKFLIAWQEKRDADKGYDILARLYDSDGQPVSDDFIVNDDLTGETQRLPAVASKNGNSFVVAWQDARNGDSDIYFQIIDGNGNPIGGNVKVNDDEANVTQAYPAVAVGGYGNFIITWVDTRNGNDDIFAQKFLSDGSFFEANYQVNNEPGSTDQRFPKVAISGNLVYHVWQDNRNADQGWDIYAQIESFFETEATLQIPRMMASSGQTIAVPIIASTDSSIGFAQFVVEYDSTVIQFNGAQVGPDISGFIKSAENANLPFPPASPWTNKNVLVQISGGGSAWFSGENKRVVMLTFEVVGSVGDSSFIVFERATNRTFLTTTNLHDINDGVIDFQGGKVKIPETINIFGNVYYIGVDCAVPDAEITLDGSLTAVTDNQGGYLFSDIDPGVHTLVPVKTNDVRNAISGADALAVLQYLAFLLTLNADQKIVADVTMDGSVSGADALAILRYLAFYTTNIGQTGNWSFMPDDTTFTASTDVAIDFTGILKGDVNLSWVTAKSIAGNTENGNKSAGTGLFSLEFGETRWKANREIELPLKINTSGQEMNTLLLSIGYDPEILTFKGIRYADQINRFQIVENSNERGKLHLAMAGIHGFLGDDEIVKFVFELKPKKETHVEVEITRAVVNDEDIVNLPTGVLTQADSGTPTKYQLFQNYPNPFNNETLIKYQTSQPGNVEIVIYDVLGKEVKTLIDENKDAGTHQIIWDARDNSGNEVASGVYFYEMRAGTYIETKKLLLMK